MLCVSLGNSVKLTPSEVKADYVATRPDMVNQFSSAKCLLVNYCKGNDLWRLMPTSCHVRSDVLARGGC